MPNEFENFLKDTKEDNPFKNPEEENDIFGFEKEESKEVEEEKEEEKVPFHKDPKVQRFIEKEISKRMDSIRPSETEKFVKEVTEEDSLVDVLTRIIGNDTPEKLSAIKDFRKELSHLEEKGAEKALSQFKAQQDAEIQAENEAVERLEEGLSDIEENFSIDITSNSPIAKKTRNDFLDFVKRVAPKDRDGNITEYPDFNETFTVFKEMRKPVPNRAKELSARSMSQSSDTSETKPTQPSNWRDLDNVFERMFGKD